MTATNDDQAAIRKLIEDWSAAVRRKDYDGVLKRHAHNILMFDVPGPFQSEGIEAYRKTWDLFFGGCRSRRNSTSRIFASQQARTRRSLQPTENASAPTRAASPPISTSA
jgi:hypothetical protein